MFVVIIEQDFDDWQLRMKAFKSTGSRVASRAASAAVLVLLCFQLSRVYLTIPMEWYVCPMTHRPLEGMSMPGHDHEYADLENSRTTSPVSPDDGCSLRCCKGTLDGMGLVPVQPFRLPVVVSVQKPELTSFNSPGQARQSLDQHLPPPFQPPRNFS